MQRSLVAMYMYMYSIWIWAPHTCTAQSAISHPGRRPLWGRVVRLQRQRLDSEGLQRVQPRGDLLDPAARLCPAHSTPQCMFCDQLQSGGLAHQKDQRSTEAAGDRQHSSWVSGLSRSNISSGTEELCVLPPRPAERASKLAASVIERQWKQKL